MDLVVPRLEATAPNHCWTWDICKRATYVPGVFLNLYLVLDLFSRYPVAWMIAERENSALSKRLFADAITRYDLKPGSITVRNDRGASRTAAGFVDLLAQLRVDRILSRPRVSNDSPFSEACFKTVKYQSDYPARFRDAAHPSRCCVEFFDWYANHRRHSVSPCSRPRTCSSVASRSLPAFAIKPSTPTRPIPRAFSVAARTYGCRPPRSL